MAKITVELNTNEDEEVIELLQRLIDLLEDAKCTK